MTTRLQQGIVLLAAQVLAGCGTSGLSSAPSAPSSSAPSTTIAPSAPAGYAPNVTLSGVVTEMIQDVQVPIEGVSVYCEPCGERSHTSAYTDNKGSIVSRECGVTHFRSG
jgi:hypothetical protein